MSSTAWFCKWLFSRIGPSIEWLLTENNVSQIAACHMSHVHKRSLTANRKRVRAVAMQRKGEQWRRGGARNLAYLAAGMEKHLSF